MGNRRIPEDEKYSELYASRRTPPALKEQKEEINNTDIQINIKHQSNLEENSKD